MSDLVNPQISVSRDIPASAASIFAVLANPAMHPRLDGTGMAQHADDTPLEKVGDVFVMHMKHWKLGDYGMENHVVEFERDRRIVWTPFGHTYQSAEFDEMLKGSTEPEVRYWGFELEALAPNLTRVTEIFDGSQLSDGLRGFLEDGEFWRLGMATSLEQLEEIVSEANDSREVPELENYYVRVRGSN